MTRRAIAVVGIVAACAGCVTGEPDEVDEQEQEPAGCGEVGLHCVDSTECPSMQICVDHTCGCMYGRDYEVEVVSAAVYARAPGGNCWDGEAPHCEDPDPYAVIEVGDTAHEAALVENTTNPIWGERFVARVDEGTGYAVSVFDADSEGEDTPILIFPTAPVDRYPLAETALRNGRIHVSQGDEGAQTVVVLIFAPL